MGVSEGELWRWMMAGNYPPGYPDFDRPGLVALERRAFATLSCDVEMRSWVGHGRPSVVRVVPKGSRVKVVMASRLGDVGITDDLDAHNGYCARVGCVEGEIAGVKFGPSGLLVDISLVEDPREDKVRLAFPEGG